MSRHVERDLGIGGRACGGHAAHVIYLGRSEVEQESRVNRPPVPVFCSEMQLCCASVYDSVVHADRQPEHVDASAVSCRDVSGQDDARETFRVFGDGVEFRVQDRHVFLAEFPAEVE